tara:strand:- start:3669 stop:4154 length:486 start_codon:yes stop_codon:yes gene_type:complete
MGSKRVGLARVQALIENLKREIQLNGASFISNDPTTGKKIALKTKSVELASTTGTSVTSADFIPADCLPVAFAVEVTKVFVRTGGALTLTDLGTDGTANAFSDAAALDCKTLGGKNLPEAAGLAGYHVHSAADTLKLTFSNAADDATGRIKVTMFYYDLSE